MRTLTTTIQHSFGSPSHSNQRRKRKGIHVGKEVKLSMFADDTVNLENSKDTNRKLLELSSELSKVQDTKQNQYTESCCIATNTH